MKRIITLLLAATLLIGAVSTASAVDVKVSGKWDFAFGFGNADFTRDGHESEDTGMKARQRFRTQINIIASESLQGVVMFEIGTIHWGQGGTVGQGSGGRLDADGVNIETKRAYLDWMIPETDIAVRMGIQALSLPMANGWCNPVFSADVAGVVINTKLDDMFGLTLWWARPFDTYLNDGADRSLDDEMDLLGLALPITGEGWKVTPWFMYAFIGASSGYLEYTGAFPADIPAFEPYENTSSHAWWLGTSLEVSMFDPLTFSVDAIYGKVSQQTWGRMGEWTGTSVPFWDDLGSADMGASGWFIAASLNYEMDWGTPGLFGWWSSGDTESGINGDMYGRLPVVGTDDGFAPTSFGFPGSANIGYDGVFSLTGIGTWGIGAQIANMSFIEKLDHTLRFAYYRGTNEHEVVERFGEPGHMSGESVYLTDKDNVYEFNFDHNYQVYENLTATVELAYIYMDLDDLANRPDYANNAWKAQLLFRYAF